LPPGQNVIAYPALFGWEALVFDVAQVKVLVASSKGKL
jgi:hypothetical protein